MKYISTGQPSTLKTYREITYILGGFKENAATRFLDKKIAKCSNGENEEVIANESQMIYMLMNMIKEENKKVQESSEINDSKS